MLISVFTFAFIRLFVYLFFALPGTTNVSFAFDLKCCNFKSRLFQTPFYRFRTLFFSLLGKISRSAFVVARRRSTGFKHV